MGHKNINVTAQYYTNVEDQEKLEAINKIGDFY
jgi:integrase